MEIERLKREHLSKDNAILESQVATQTKFNKMMAEENDVLGQQLKEMEGILVAERRAAKRNGNEAAPNINSNMVNELNKKSATLQKEMQSANEKIAMLLKENAHFKEVINSYSVNVVHEHNYCST